MKRKIISIIAAAVLGMAGIADSAPDSNSIVKDGIEYYIQTDKSVYHLGESVEMLYRVTNLGDEDVTFEFAIQQQIYFEVSDNETRIWGWPKLVNPAGSSFTLQPGEFKEYLKYWDMINDNTGALVIPGNYDVTGVLHYPPSHERYVPVSVQIEIIHEPAKTYYVDAADGSDDNDGLTPETAFATIQKAIDSAFDGDTVLVADGTYTGEGNRDIDFLGKAITVQSESGPENCIIDCNGTADEPHRGFRFVSGEGRDSVCSGLTITNGYAPRKQNGYPASVGGAIYCVASNPTINCCNIRGNYAKDEGGGIYCVQSSLTITNCDISDNRADPFMFGGGGGIYCYDSTPTISYCSIRGNTASPGEGGGGGGIYSVSSKPTISNCTISENIAAPGWFGGSGGGIQILSSDAIITNCTINNNWSYQSGGGIEIIGGSPRIINSNVTGNSTESSGGGISISTYSHPTITNCIISGNIAGWNGGGIDSDVSSLTINNCAIVGNTADDGGGIYFYDSDPTITNCTISGNLSRGDGSGILAVASSLTITNCTISGNKGRRQGGGIYCWGSLTITNCTITGNLAEYGGGIRCRGDSVTITNCILWDNLSEQISGHPSITYSDIQQQDGWEWWDYEGCISADPCFVEPGYWVDANDPNAVWIDGDYHLLPDSPCIDAGDPNYIAEPNETDLDGNPRVSGDAIDMGAYETITHEARLLLLPRVINRKSKQARIMAWVRLPQGITKDQIDSDTALILYPAGIEAMRQFVFQNRRRDSERVSIFAFFDKAELMDAIPANGRVELQVLGHLRQPGQYFYGSDTIRIKTRRLRSSLKAFLRARATR